MSPRVSRLVFAAQLGALALMAAWLLLRDALAIGWRVPLDPNEGWNAYHAAAELAGLYPPPQSLMVNNYPPLSFAAIEALGWLIPDHILAGRIVSLASFLATAACIVWLLRRMGCAIGPAAFGALVFACGLLIGSNYVGIDDPQLLGHALQVAGLILLLREKIIAAALAMAAGLFVKHNLVAPPLASLLWVAWQDRRAATRFALAGIGFGLVGLVLFRIVSAFSLMVLASPRIYAFANFRDVSWRFLLWAGAAAEFSVWLAIRQRRDPWVQFAALYGAIALVVGLVFSAGDGVDANIYFDAAIALGLTAGLIQQRFGAYGRCVAGVAVAVPLALFLWSHWADDNFAYTGAFRAQAPHDIAFLGSGPALCEQLSLCYWAGEKSPVDVFNLGEAIATGKRSDAPLVHLLESRHFKAVQFDSLEAFALGPHVRDALAKNYRVDHEDDNGVFLRPR